MSAKAAPTCPNCHGPLPLGGDAKVIECAYCGREVMREQPGPPAGAPQAGVPIRIEMPRQATPVQVHMPRVKWLVILFAGLPLIVGAIIFSVVARKVNRATQAVPPSSTGGVNAPKGEHMQWSGVAPLPADIDGDGVEDFVGRYQILRTGETEVYLGAFDGKTLKRRWKAGPYGDLGEAGAIEFTVSGDRALVSDPSNFLHVLELSTGRELHSVRLTDKVAEMCPFPEDDAKVWIAIADEKNVILDLATGQSKSAGRPEHCPGRSTFSREPSCWRSDYHRERRAHAACLEPDEAPDLSGFRSELVLEDGGHRAAIGHKHPGTAVPMVMGFQGSGKKASVTWSRNLAEDGYAASQELTDMVDGRVILVYQTKRRGWRVCALEATTGNTIFDVALPKSEDGSSPSEMQVTPSRVYVPHWTWLDIYEIASGEHLGTVGVWY